MIIIRDDSLGNLRRKVSQWGIESTPHMNKEELVETWKCDEQQPFSGWDFSHLDSRMTEDNPPWDYALRAAELMKQSTSMVDLGTGGGERFLSLKEYWPQKVAVTEYYPPNFKLAVERLAPLGVRVVNCDYNTPFTDEEFDLVLNRCHQCPRCLQDSRTWRRVPDRADSWALGV